MKIYEPCFENYGIFSEGLNNLASVLRIANCPIVKIDISFDGKTAFITFARYRHEVKVAESLFETIEIIIREVKKIMQADETITEEMK